MNDTDLGRTLRTEPFNFIIQFIHEIANIKDGI